MAQLADIDLLADPISRNTENTVISNEKNVKASLDKLAELLIATEECANTSQSTTVGLETGGSEGSTENASLAEELLNRLGPTLDEYMQTDPKKAYTLMAAVKDVLEKASANNINLRVKIVEALRPIIQKYVLSHPDQMGNVLLMIAPFNEEKGEEVRKLKNFANTAISHSVQLAKDLDQDSVQAKSKQLFDEIQESVDREIAIYQQIRPTLEKLYAQDASKMGQFLSHLAPFLSQVAAHGKEGQQLLTQLLQEEQLEQLYHSDETTQKSKLGGYYKDSHSGQTSPASSS